jgi:hypothetical protein
MGCKNTAESFLFLGALTWLKLVYRVYLNTVIFFVMQVFQMYLFLI